MRIKRASYSGVAVSGTALLLVNTQKQTAVSQPSYLQMTGQLFFHWWFGAVWGYNPTITRYWIFEVGTNKAAPQKSIKLISQEASVSICMLSVESLSLFIEQNKNNKVAFCKLYKPNLVERRVVETEVSTTCCLLVALRLSDQWSWLNNSLTCHTTFQFVCLSNFHNTNIFCWH